jgi:hypothetical protein
MPSLGECPVCLAVTRDVKRSAHLAWHGPWALSADFDAPPADPCPFPRFRLWRNH